jgi:hypothetical protein
MIWERNESKLNVTNMYNHAFSLESGREIQWRKRTFVLQGKLEYDDHNNVFWNMLKQKV